MWFQNFFKSLASTSTRARPTRRRSPSSRLSIERLEDRTVPAFLAPVSYFVGYVGPQAVVTADFNGDTRLDLAAVYYSNSNVDDSSVRVLLGNADGTFQSALNSPTGSYPHSLAVGDFDGDGDLDVATANDGNLSVLLGNGNGTFQAANNIGLGLGSRPNSLAVGDFNGDGLHDLGVTSNVYNGFYEGYSGSANVLLGNGLGSFSGPYITPLGWGYHTAAVAANLNGDVFDDFVTVKFYNDSVSVLLGTGTGYLQGPSNFSTGSAPLSVAAGDVNGDTVTDLVAANWLGNDVSVLLGDGLGSFSTAGNYATGLNPLAVVLGDFTGDGKVDVATGQPASSELSVLYGRGGGTFSSAVNSVGSYPSGVAAGDFNGDGWLDAATADTGGDTVSVLINDHYWQAPPPPPPPSVTINDVRVTEGNTGTLAATFTVTLSAASSEAVTITYATADGTATAGSDYKTTSGTLTFAPGETSKTITVQVTGDRVAESNETLSVNLSNPTNATIGDGVAVGTIVDDEPRVSVNDVTRTEGNKGTTLFAFIVSLSAASDAPVTVSFATADGGAIAGSDYQAMSGTLTIPAGQTTGTIAVLVNGDTLAEANEAFAVNLSNPVNADIADGQGAGTIVDDDPPINISISDATKKEGNGKKTTQFTFTVTLSAACDEPVTMSYSTTNGTATTSDNDFVAKTGMLTFAPGETTKTITIEVKGDRKKEATETFYLDLFESSSNSLFTKNRGLGTILNDD